MDQKMAQSKKVVVIKNQFFMPVNHAKEFLKSVHNGALFLQLFAQASTSGTLKSKLFDLICLL